MSMLKALLIGGYADGCRVAVHEEERTVIVEEITPIVLRSNPAPPTKPIMNKQYIYTKRSLFFNTFNKPQKCLSYFAQPSMSDGEAIEMLINNYPKSSVDL